MPGALKPSAWSCSQSLTMSGKSEDEARASPGNHSDKEQVGNLLVRHLFERSKAERFECARLGITRTLLKPIRRGALFDALCSTSGETGAGTADPRRQGPRFRAREVAGARGGRQSCKSAPDLANLGKNGMSGDRSGRWKGRSPAYGRPSMI